MSSSSLACITSGACFAGSGKGWTLSPVAPAVHPDHDPVARANRPAASSRSRSCRRSRPELYDLILVSACGHRRAALA